MGCGISNRKYNQRILKEKIKLTRSNDDSPKFTSFDLKQKNYNVNLKDYIVDMDYSKHHERIYEIFKDVIV